MEGRKECCLQDTSPSSGWFWVEEGVVLDALGGVSGVKGRQAALADAGSCGGRVQGRVLELHAGRCALALLAAIK